MPFDLQPILKGEFLELRPLRAEDFAEFVWDQGPTEVGETVLSTKSPLQLSRKKDVPEYGIN